MQDVASHFLRARKSYAKAAIVQAGMREELVREILAIKGEYERVFEFGAGQDELGKRLREKIKFKEYIASDINSFNVQKSGVKFIKLDMTKPMPKELGCFDLVASNACLQWLNAQKTIKNIQNALKSGGVLAISSFGEQNLKQIKALTGLGLKYPTLDELNLACSGLKDVKIYSKIIDIKFDSALELFYHLKHSGVNSLGQVYLSKAILKRCEMEFKNTLTYEPVFIIAKA